MTVWLAAVAAVVAVVALGRPPPNRLSRLGVPAGPREAVAAEPNGLPRGRALVVAALASTGGVAAGAPLPLVVVALVSAVAVPEVRRRMRERAVRAERRLAAVEVTVALAAELRAGRNGGEALGAAAAIPGALSTALTAAARSATTSGRCGEELEAVARTPGAERLRVVGVAWAAAERSGGQLAVVLDRLAEAMDDDEVLRGELEAAMAGPRSTMALLAVLPLVGLALGQSIGSSPLHFLLHTPAGEGCLGVAAGLDAAGIWVTRTITRRAMAG